MIESIHGVNIHRFDERRNSAIHDCCRAAFYGAPRGGMHSRATACLVTAFGQQDKAAPGVRNVLGAT